MTDMTNSQPQFLGQQTPLPASPEEAVLDYVLNPRGGELYLVRFAVPEFTSLCPVTGAPDFAHLVIDYAPGATIVESKSLKLFLGSFRNHSGFHEDVTVHFTGGSYEWKVQGRQDYVNNIGASFSREAVGQHNAHHPEIQMLSETEATAIWYLEDNMWILNHNARTRGTALYWDRYLKVNGKWLIKDTNYERIYEINDQLDARPNLSSHYLGTHGGEPQF